MFFPNIVAFSEPVPTPEMMRNSYPSPEAKSEPEMYGNMSGNTAPEGEPSAPTISDSATRTILTSIAGLVSSGIIIENIIVLFVIARRWPKQNSNITYFIIHLACADLISGFQFLWFHCIDVHLRLTHEGYWVLILCGLWMVTIAASMGGILNFASFRAHAMKNAMKTETFSRRRAILTIVFSWGLPFTVLFLPPLLGWSCVNATKDQLLSGTECSQAVFPFKKGYLLLLACLLLATMVCLTGYYIAIFVLVRKKFLVPNIKMSFNETFYALFPICLAAVAGHTLKSVKHITRSSSTQDTENRLLVTMVTILALFFVCHLPVAGVLIADFVVSTPCPPIIDAFQIILTLSFVNSLLNPLVYYWGMPATRDAFWLAFGARLRTECGRAMCVNTKIGEKSDAYKSATLPSTTSNTASNTSVVESASPIPLDDGQPHLATPPTSKYRLQDRASR